MAKGVAWPELEVKQLLSLRGEGKTVSEIAVQMGKSDQAVTKKLQRLGFKVVQRQNSNDTTTSVIIPRELISVEEALKISVSVLEALKAPGLSKTEILRLRTLLAAANTYQEKVTKYMDYLGVERELVKLTEQYCELTKQQRESGKLANSRKVKKDE